MMTEFRLSNDEKEWKQTKKLKYPSILPSHKTRTIQQPLKPQLMKKRPVNNPKNIH